MKPNHSKFVQTVMEKTSQALNKEKDKELGKKFIVPVKNYLLSNENGVMSEKQFKFNIGGYSFKVNVDDAIANKDYQQQQFVVNLGSQNLRSRNNLASYSKTEVTTKNSSTKVNKTALTLCQDQKKEDFSLSYSYGQFRSRNGANNSSFADSTKFGYSNKNSLFSLVLQFKKQKQAMLTDTPEKKYLPPKYIKDEKILPESDKKQQQSSVKKIAISKEIKESMQFLGNKVFINKKMGIKGEIRNSKEVEIESKIELRTKFQNPDEEISLRCKATNNISGDVANIKVASQLDASIEAKKQGNLTFTESANMTHQGSFSPLLILVNWAERVNLTERVRRNLGLENEEDISENLADEASLNQNSVNLATLTSKRLVRSASRDKLIADSSFCGNRFDTVSTVDSTAESEAGEFKLDSSFEEAKSFVKNSPRNIVSSVNVFRANYIDGKMLLP